MTNQGHTVTVADNGASAVEKHANEESDLVLMDLEMPGMDGLDATRGIRRLEEVTQNHIPIIAMTAHALESGRKRCVDAGMDEYITKPIRQETVLKTIADLIGT